LNLVRLPTPADDARLSPIQFVDALANEKGQESRDTWPA
jgi:hypothetical protein